MLLSKKAIYNNHSDEQSQVQPRGMVIKKMDALAFLLQLCCTVEREPYLRSSASDLSPCNPSEIEAAET